MSSLVKPLANVFVQFVKHERSEHLLVCKGTWHSTIKIRSRSVSTHVPSTVTLDCYSLNPTIVEGMQFLRDVGHREPSLTDIGFYLSPRHTKNINSIFSATHYWSVTRISRNASTDFGKNFSNLLLGAMPTCRAYFVFDGIIMITQPHAIWKLTAYSCRTMFRAASIWMSYLIERTTCSCIRVVWILRTAAYRI